MPSCQSRCPWLRKDAHAYNRLCSSSTAALMGRDCKLAQPVTAECLSHASESCPCSQHESTGSSAACLTLRAAAAQMRQAVRAVARLFPTAIITGRGRDKVLNFVQLRELFYAGSHGLDIIGPQVSIHLSYTCS